MTRLEAGRALDKLIAGLVMGWGSFWEDPDGIWLMGCPPTWTIEDDKDEVPRYSTDLTAAWEVVERLAALGWEASLTRWVTLPDGKARTSCYLEYNDPETGAYVRSREVNAGVGQMPLAVCWAALAVIAGREYTGHGKVRRT